MRATFPPTARLHRPSEYAQALKGQRIAKGALFVVMSPRATSNNTPADAAPRLGLIIAKRHARNAVTRNTIKRIIREVFRHKQARLAARDYVFRLIAPVHDLSLRQLKARVRTEVNALLDQTISCSRPS